MNVDIQAIFDAHNENGILVTLGDQTIVYAELRDILKKAIAAKCKGSTLSAIAKAIETLEIELQSYSNS